MHWDKLISLSLPQVLAVKMGYLVPDLEDLAALNLMALTPGGVVRPLRPRFKGSAARCPLLPRRSSVLHGAWPSTACLPCRRPHSTPTW